MHSHRQIMMRTGAQADSTGRGNEASKGRGRLSHECLDHARPASLPRWQVLRMSTIQDLDAQQSRMHTQIATA